MKWTSLFRRPPINSLIPEELRINEKKKCDEWHDIYYGWRKK
jgi:regulation of enolase protein 1 (concanavalin A-like superfamily)